MAMKITVQKNIPMPEPGGRGRSRVSKYPFATMEIGDSFALQRNPSDTLTMVVMRAKAAIFGQKRAHPDTHYEWRYVTENDVETVRIWRINPQGD